MKVHWKSSDPEFSGTACGLGPHLEVSGNASEVTCKNCQRTIPPKESIRTRWGILNGDVEDTPQPVQKKRRHRRPKPAVKTIMSDVSEPDTPVWDPRFPEPPRAS